MKPNTLKQMVIDPLDIVVSAGDVIALVGVKATDISKIFMRFNINDPIRQHKQRKYKDSSVPIIQCIKRKSDLFESYTAYENFQLTEKSLLPYNKKHWTEICNNIKKLYRINIDFDTKVKNMSMSERIIVDVVRSYILNSDMLVMDNLLSFLSFEHANIIISILNDLKEKNKIILYLTTKWEDAIKIANHIYVVMDDVVLGEMSTEEVKKNPQHLIYLLSGRKLIEDMDSNDGTTELLSLLNTGAEYLTNNYELKDAIGYVAHNITRVLHANKSIIYLLNSETKQIHSFTDTPIQFTDELNTDFVRHQIENNKESAVFYATFDDPNFTNYFISSDVTCKTLLCIPIYNKSNVRGLLQVTYQDYFVYDKRELLYLKTFCKEIAIIVETSRLMGNSILLQESNHRIKNNLQTIVNIIYMQQIYISNNSDCDVNEILNTIIGRIQNIARLHEFLSSKLQGEDAINLRDIVNAVINSCDLNDVTMDINIDDIYIPYIKATSISMVVNELITNSLKYAFKHKSNNRILIECHYFQNHNILKICDNGVGMPEGFDLNQTYGIGFSIIKSIVQIDLKGSFQIETDGSGTTATILLPPW